MAFFIKRPQNKHDIFSILGLPSPYYDSEQKYILIHIQCLKHWGKQEAQNAKRPKLARHPVWINRYLDTYIRRPLTKFSHFINETVSSVVAVESHRALQNFFEKKKKTHSQVFPTLQRASTLSGEGGHGSYGRFSHFFSHDATEQLIRGGGLGSRC